MTEYGQIMTTVRDVQFNPESTLLASVEVTTLAAMRRRGGRAEFVDPQRLDFEMVIVVETGQTSHEVDFVTYELGPTDVLWVHSGQVHRWGVIENIDGPVLLFPPDALSAEAADAIDKSGLFIQSFFPEQGRASTPFAATLRALCESDAALRGGPHDDLNQQAIRLLTTAALLLLTSSNRPLPQSMSDSSRVLHWFKEEVERSFRSHRGLSHYAERLGYSSRTIDRAVRSHTGMSAKSLIDQRVILEAKRLLIHANTSAAEIGLELGFADAANFSKFFRHQVGQAPGEFRRERA